MKLPTPQSIHDPDHWFLYEHDVVELYNPDKAHFTHLMYETRFRTVLEAVDRYALGKLVLDVGCAQGNFSLALAEKGYRVVAMDLRLSYLQYLLLKYERGNLRCATASVAHFPFRPASFDVVLLGEILEHVAYPEELLKLAAVLLKTPGVLIATTPNGRRLHTGLPTMSAIPDREPLRLLQYRPDADGHLFLLTERELRELARQLRLSVVEHRYFGTPWVTGRLGFRYIGRLIPVWIRRLLDRATLRVSVLGRLFSDGQILVARPTSS